MGKGRIFGVIATLVGAATLAIHGCGETNDQGISFRAIGFTQEDGAFKVQYVLDFTRNFQVPNDEDCDGVQDGGFINLQNNLLQGINVERIDLSYTVTGGSISIPNDSFPLSMRLGPSSGQEEQNPPFNSAQIVAVSAHTVEFLDQNRTRLPDTPYTLVVTARALGTTDAGDIFQTNRVRMSVTTCDGCHPSIACEEEEEPSEEGGAV